jgi:aspartate racemase
MATGSRRYREVRRIGLLGGIGPEATGIFYLQVIRKLQASGAIKSNTDFPQFIINSIPAPELLDPSVSGELLDPYIKGLKELDRYGVEFVVMICNTIHAYHALLQAQIKTPILDLRVEVEKEMKTNGIKSALILATPTTIESGLLKFDGIKYHNPSKRELETIIDSIHKFNSGVRKEEQGALLSSMANKYINRGAEAVILGCTEISLMMADFDMKKIDTMDVLSEATVKLILQT